MTTRRPSSQHAPEKGAGGPDTRAIMRPRQLRDEPLDHEEAPAGQRPFHSIGELTRELLGTGVQQRQHVGLTTRVFQSSPGRGPAAEVHARVRPDSVAFDPTSERTGSQVASGMIQSPSPRSRRTGPMRPEPVEGTAAVNIEGLISAPTYLSPEPAPEPAAPPFTAEAYAPEPAAPPRAGEAYAPAAAAQGSGEVVVFFGCRGGVGSTLLATSLGTVLAAVGCPACLIDLDLQLGEALSYLGVESRVPISALVRDMDTVDWDLLSARLPRHASGLCALSQTGFVDELHELEPTRLPGLLAHLRRQFRVVIVDGVRDFNDHALAALDAADRVVLVSTQDVPSVRGVARRLHIMRRLGFPTERFHLVLNRFSPSSAMTPELVAEEIGLEPSFNLVNDFATASRAINEGRSVRECGPGSVLSGQIDEMARRLFGVQVEAQRPGLFARLFGRRER